MEKIIFKLVFLNIYNILIIKINKNKTKNKMKQFIILAAIVMLASCSSEPAKTETTPVDTLVKKTAVDSTAKDSIAKADTTK